MCPAPEPPSSKAVFSMSLKVCRCRAGASLSADGAGAVRAPAKMTLPRSRQAASTVGYMCSRLIIPGLCPICDCAYNIEAIQASRSCALRVLKVICEKRVPISKTNERQSLGVACRRERDAESAACRFMRKYRRRSYDQEYVFHGIQLSMPLPHFSTADRMSNRRR